MVEAYRNLPEPERLFALVEAVQPIHGEARDISTQSFMSRELITYGLGIEHNSSQALSGHIHRQGIGSRHELWKLFLRDTFRTRGAFQHTTYNFCWDENRAYHAERSVILGGMAARASVEELETQMHATNMIDLDAEARKLDLTSRTSMSIVSAADASSLVGYVRQMVNEHVDIERAMRR